ncbi:hypothetical protein EI546_05930 [Aequorivita sp. H23M31]|uniref:Sulfotransferase domain-containing protein n=1 Tax=Aequorivita ciconiae TaxID=2494375 RepID=A0A410G203_9FLAO|nr:hypothetical protein [Aequorivita sp. H23M31]QAA81294.1 hypothetical protein EI546_05930 [Aequorivita sp. H23M31]
MRKIIESSPFLFYIWYHLVRKNRGLKIDYFSQKTKFSLDGYPRSGNTFATSLVKNIFGKDVFIHHFHAIAPIKVSLRKNIPAFILIREPEEAITSYYLKWYSFKRKPIPKEINTKLLKKLTNQYVEYYKYVQQKKNKLEIIEFRDLVRNPKQFIADINNKVYQNELEIGSAQMEKAINSYRGATETFGSSKPNPEKKDLKEL